MKKFICILCFILLSFTEVGCYNKATYNNNKQMSTLSIVDPIDENQIDIY